jgi:hypothetical protein
VNESEAFAEFDEELKLDPAERKAAQRLHNEMTQLLIRAGVIVSAFLQGSFARKTMLAPLRDIDKIVIMAGRLAGQPDLQARPELAMDRSAQIVHQSLGGHPEVQSVPKVAPACRSPGHRGNTAPSEYVPSPSILPGAV